eukprot:4011340-Pyramimonas_sp.AAC.1
MDHKKGAWRPAVPGRSFFPGSDPRRQRPSPPPLAPQPTGRALRPRPAEIREGAAQGQGQVLGVQ